MQKTLLLTGAAGYIGSHAVVAFEQAGYKTVILDNLSNSSRSSLDAITKILGYTPDFYEGDIRDESFLCSVFEKYSFDGVIHFAAKKYVMESITDPFGYFINNVSGTLILLKVMEHFHVKDIIFSSTAGVYDSNNQVPPFSEDTPKKTIHPYAASKLMIEEILEQLALSKRISSLSLRYFNVMGAHESGLLGDNYFTKETNVVGFLYRTILGKQESFSIYGKAFQTKDGTAIRDYIDVWDLVQAHVKAYEYLTLNTDFTAESMNIGNGVGVTVQELHDTMEEVLQKKIPVEYKEPRYGDVAVSVSSPEKAFQLLGWKPYVTLGESIERGWRFINAGK